MKKLILLPLFILFFWIGFSSSVFATQLFFEGPTTVTINETFQVTLKIDAQGDRLNALEGTIPLQNNNLVIENILNKDSVVNTWIFPPAESSEGVTFAGIIPGGFSGVQKPFDTALYPGTILVLEISVSEPGEYQLPLSNVSVLQHDTQAQELPVRLNSFSFRAIEGGSTLVEPAQQEEVVDTTPPEPFEVYVLKQDDIYSGQYVLLFSTTDTQSGVDRYEVREGNGDWHSAQNPYILKEQGFRAPVWVKAIDEEGNERVEQVTPPSSANDTAGIIWVLILASLIILGSLVYVLRKNTT